MKWEGEYPPAPPANKRFDELLEKRRELRVANLRKYSAAWNRGDISPPRRIDIKAPGWAAPIYWVEMLPRARWWAWLRAKLMNPWKK